MKGVNTYLAAIIEGIGEEFADRGLEFDRFEPIADEFFRVDLLFGGRVFQLFVDGRALGSFVLEVPAFLRIDEEESPGLMQLAWQVANKLHGELRYPRFIFDQHPDDKEQLFAPSPQSAVAAGLKLGKWLPKHRADVSVNISFALFGDFEASKWVEAFDLAMEKAIEAMNKMADDIELGGITVPIG